MSTCQAPFIDLQLISFWLVYSLHDWPEVIWWPEVYEVHSLSVIAQEDDMPPSVVSD